MCPEIEDVVQVDVGQQRRDDRALRRAFLACHQLAFFQRAGLQPFAYEANDAWVTDSVLQELDQPLVADRVEEALDVGVHDPAHMGARDAHRQRIQRLMLAALRPADRSSAWSVRRSPGSRARSVRACQGL
jgi:hypothetical protein